jgi:hypothetical protein
MSLFNASRWIDETGRNVRQALRHLRRAPGFTGTAVLTLALCIGANASLFSVVDRVLLRPLPYPHAERLVAVATAWRGEGGAGVNTLQEGVTFWTIRQRATLLDSAAASMAGGINFDGQGKPEYVQQQRVSAGFFRVLRVRPYLGREFTVEEEKAGGPAVLVLSYALWQRHFRAEQAVIGRAVTLGGQPAVVIGVMPAGFETNAPTDLWAPLRPAKTEEAERQSYDVVARLRPGATFAAAEGEIEALSAAAPLAAFHTMAEVRHGAMRGRRFQATLLVLLSGLAMVLAAVGIYGLIASAVLERTRELGIRMALGGSVRQVMTAVAVPGILLTLVGIVVGALPSVFAVRLLGHLLWGVRSDDPLTIAMAPLLLLVVAFAASVVPARRAARLDPAETLRHD